MRLNWARLPGAWAECPSSALALLRRLEAEVVAFNEEYLDAATTAFLRFGRGRYPAALNFGDCMGGVNSYNIGAPAFVYNRR